MEQLTPFCTQSSHLFDFLKHLRNLIVEIALSFHKDQNLRSKAGMSCEIGLVCLMAYQPSVGYFNGKEKLQRYYLTHGTGFKRNLYL